MKKKFENALRAAGYRASGYGFMKDTVEYFGAGDRFVTRHWVTLFDKEEPLKLQMYAYNADEGIDDLDKLYDTGTVAMSVDQLNIFIQVLCK